MRLTRTALEPFRNASGIARASFPGGKEGKRKGNGRGEPNCSSIGNWRHHNRASWDGSLRDQSAGV